MADKPSRPVDQKQGVPVWIVSFSDMITLLLSFFVLLQTLASTRDPALFYVGQGSFRRAISSFGIPGLLYGKKPEPEMPHLKVKHATVEEDSPDASRTRPRRRIIDDDDVRIRKAFADLQRIMEAEQSNVRERLLPIDTPRIRFRPFSATIEPDSGARIDAYVAGLRQHLRSGRIKIYVIGLAAAGPDARQTWLLSARRARTVQTRLRKALADELGKRVWEIQAWGSGAGGEWCRRLNLTPGEPRRGEPIAAIATVEMVE